MCCVVWFSSLCVACRVLVVARWLRFVVCCVCVAGVSNVRWLCVRCSVSACVLCVACVLLVVCLMCVVCCVLFVECCSLLMCVVVLFGMCCALFVVCVLLVVG